MWLTPGNHDHLASLLRICIFVQNTQLCLVCAALVPLCCMYKQLTSWAAQQSCLPILWLVWPHFLGSIQILRLHVYTGGVTTQMAGHGFEN